MRASLVRVPSRLAVTVLAVAAVGALVWSPAYAAPGPADGHDKFGPGYAIPAATATPPAPISAPTGPPGMKVYGTYETFCADPTHMSPDAAGGYTGPETVEHWTSSVTGRPAPETHLAYASFIVGKYGQTRSAAQAAAVDAAVYEWLAGGIYGIDGARGKQRLAYPEVDPSARTTALGFLAEAKKYAGPYRRARRARISIPQPPWRGLDRSRVRISELHALCPLPGGASPAGSLIFRLSA
ncbi:hypothetical protein [Streptomyces bungoensis]|uniref:hypothetical protein n=1 Tax=Streptomyces bungoensis TaxID=285568 RepID=UPI00344752FD